jgi:hypothetical protein
MSAKLLAPHHVRFYIVLKVGTALLGSHPESVVTLICVARVLDRLEYVWSQTDCKNQCLADELGLQRNGLVSQLETVGWNCGRSKKVRFGPFGAMRQARHPWWR